MREGETESGRERERESGRAGERESGRAGERESGRAGERESGRAGERESGRTGDKETRRQGDKVNPQSPIRNPQSSDPQSAIHSPQSFTTLIANHEVVNLPSASALAIIRLEAAGRQAAQKTLAALADPVFDTSDPRLVTARKKASASGLIAIARSAESTSASSLLSSELAPSAQSF